MENGSPIIALFSHLMEVFELEMYKPVKIAFKLTHQALFPGPIDRQNVQLTHAIFNDSTVQALEFYGNRNHPEFLGTAKFLQIILKWWKLVNTKTSFQAALRRDNDLLPITPDNLIEKTSFLRAFVDWLIEWECLKENKKSGGLSKETFEAARHTSAGLADLGEYLINVKKVKYFVPGKCQSDPIEGKFGQYRQMTGGNSYASVRQFVESERTLRVKNLSKLNLSLSEIKDMFSVSKQSRSESEKKIAKDIHDYLKVQLGNLPLENATDSDKNVIFYIAGCFGRQISMSKNCDFCKKLLLDNESQSFEVLDESSLPTNAQSHLEYFEQVNRGGLSVPSELNFNFCCHAWSLYNSVRKFDYCSNLLFSPNVSSRSIFLDLMHLNLKDSEKTVFLVQKCSNGHPFLDISQILTQKIFNLFSKNFVSETNSKIHQFKKRQPSSIKDKRDSMQSKIAKLQSQNF